MDVTGINGLSWFPVLVTLVVASAIGGKHLFNSQPVAPATASAILSFASTLSGFLITNSPLSSDYTNYYRPNVSRHEIQIIEKATYIHVEDLLLTRRSFYLHMHGFYHPSCVSIYLSLFYYLQPTNSSSCLSDFNPISWSRSRGCRILRPWLGARICQWRQRGWATWSQEMNLNVYVLAKHTPGRLTPLFKISSIDILLLCIFLLLKIVPDLNVRSRWSWFLKDASWLFSVFHQSTSMRPISLARSLTTSMHLKLVSSVKSRKEPLLWYVHVIHFWINVLIKIYHSVTGPYSPDVISRCIQFRIQIYQRHYSFIGNQLSSFKHEVMIIIIMPVGCEGLKW